AYLKHLRERAYHPWAEALDLARRLLACPRRPDVPAPLVRDLERSVLNLYRHLGHTEESVALARPRAEALRQTTCTSHDERAQADTEVASGLFDLHDFAGVVGLLGPWRDRFAADPLLVPPETRVTVFNTLGRALVQLGPEGWEGLFGLSLE